MHMNDLAFNYRRRTIRPDAPAERHSADGGRTRHANPTNTRPLALDKGLDILELLSRSREPLSQAEIARSLDVPLNETYRMLNVLVRRRFRPHARRRPLPAQPQAAVAGQCLSAHAAHARDRRADHAAHLMGHPPILPSGDLGRSPCRGRGAGGDAGPVALVAARGIAYGALHRLGPDADRLQNDRQRRFMIASYQLVEGEAKVDEATSSPSSTRSANAVSLREPSPTLEGVVNITFPILDPNDEAVCTLTCPYIHRIDN